MSEAKVLCAGPALVRIDAGSLKRNFTDSAGALWQADRSYSGEALLSWKLSLEEMKISLLNAILLFQHPLLECAQGCTPTQENKASCIPAF